MIKKTYNLSDPKYFQDGALKNIRGGPKVQAKMPPFNQEQQEIIIGTMLGDCTMGYSNGKPKLSLKFEQCKEHEDYVFHLFEKFKDFVGTGPRVRKENNEYKSLWFRTFRVDSLKFYSDLFYAAPEALPPKKEAAESADVKKDSLSSPKKKLVKGVPKNIQKFLTPRALAYWFMDDGTYHIGDGVKSYVLSTQGFTKTENERLRDALKAKFNLSSGVHKDKDKWRIGIHRESTELFLSIIKPYLHPDFNYKII